MEWADKYTDEELFFIVEKFIKSYKEIMLNMYE
jgi:hypothetical protein